MVGILNIRKYKHKNDGKEKPTHHPVIMFGVAILLTLNGCVAPAGEGSAPKKIVVATSGAPKPFSYVDEQGNLMGYDLEVMRAVFAKLPEYSVTFEVTEFTSVLAGLDTDRYQVAANNFAMNEERKYKYIYSEPIFRNQYVVAVAGDDDSIGGFGDFRNKTTEVAPGLNYATALENYNQSLSSDPVRISYSEAELLNMLQNVESGKYDFQLIDKAMAQQYIQEHRLKLKLVDLSDEDISRMGGSYSYVLVANTLEGKVLMKKINGALQAIIEDGTISSLSKKYFNGEDHAPKKRPTA